MSQEYRIVVSSKVITLEEIVADLLNKGWKLQGGVSVGANPVSWGYAQAMIREKQNNK